jgi:hypothetical protein
MQDAHIRLKCSCRGENRGVDADRDEDARFARWQAFGLDDIDSRTPYAEHLAKMPFSVWVTLTEHKWVTFGERRGKLILMASSTCSKVRSSTTPRRLMIRTRSTARIWLNRATEVAASPVEEFASSNTWTGLSGNRTVDVIGATMVMSLNRLEVSFE